MRKMTARPMAWLLRLVLPGKKGGQIVDTQSGHQEEHCPRIVLPCPPRGVVVIR